MPSTRDRQGVDLHHDTIKHLRELVQAIDRRSWHFERKGESEIVRDAEALRQKALERIAELERTTH